MASRKRRNIDSDTKKQVLAADSESGKFIEHIYKEVKKILQGRWLQVQQIDVEEQCGGEGERKAQKQPIKLQAISSSRGVS